MRVAELRLPARVRSSAKEPRHVRLAALPAGELLGLEPAEMVDEVAAVVLDDPRHVGHAALAADPDAQHDPALPNGGLVPGEVGCLVGPAELDDPIDAAEQA